MTLRALAFGCALAVLAGCAGHSPSSSDTSLAPASVLPAAAHVRTHAGRPKMLIVGSFTRPSALYTVPATANGVVDPKRSIVITNVLHFVKTQAIAYDASLHRVWMASCIALSGKTAPILAFDLDKSTDTPSRKIHGANTTLGNCITGMALDSSANLYVGNFVAEGSPGGDVPVFAPNSDGDVAPEHSIHGRAPDIRSVGGIAVDAQDRLWATSTCFAFNQCPGTGITAYAKDAKGDVAPVISIPGGKITDIGVPEGIAFDKDGRIYVADDAARIEVFAPNADGEVKPEREIFSKALCRPTGIAVDDDGYVYVGNQCEEPNWPIVVFAPHASGLVGPVQKITIKVAEPSVVVPSGIALEY